MRTVVIGNNKGGVAKTTTALCLASILTAKHKKVLYIDADSQCNSTRFYEAEIDGVCTLYDLLLDRNDPCTLEEAIQHTPKGDVIAGDPKMSDADRIMYRAEGDDIYFWLRNALTPLSGYDYVIIDVNPSMNMMFFNALVASDGIIIPVNADSFSTDGYITLYNYIKAIADRYNPDLTIDGVLITRYKGNTLIQKGVREGIAQVCNNTGSYLFTTPIREATKIQEATLKKQFLLDYAKSCPQEQEYETFAEEWIKRVKKKGGK